MTTFNSFETIYFLVITNMETGNELSMPDAFVSLDAAKQCIAELEFSDRRNQETGRYSYQIRTGLLFR